MGTLPSRATRLGRSALIVGVAGGMIATGGARLAHAEVQVDSGYGSGPQCLIDYSADGNAVVIGGALEIPYENVAGGPYTAVALTAQPDSRALASEDYEGLAGEIVLGTSGFYPSNPTTAQAFWPTPVGGRSADQHDDGPFARTTAFAEPRKAVADAKAMNVASSEQGQSGGLTLAHSESSFDGTLVKGSQVATGYDFTLGPLHIDFLRSQVEWRSDGTDAGSVATWRLDFHGVRNGNAPVYSASGDGWSFQGSNAQPGEAQRRQFNEQQQKLSQALEQAGIGQADLQVQPGTVSVAGDHMDIKGAAMIVRLAPKPMRGQTTQGASLQLGRVEQHVRAGQGPCDAVGNPPEFKQQDPPAGPNPPKVPPDKCSQSGCKAQKFPPDLPGLPGGKTPA
jgi:hypothetical protein